MHAELAVGTEHHAVGDLIAGRKAALQVHVGARQVERVVVPVRIEERSERRARTVRIQRRLNPRPIGRGQERIVDVDLDVAARLTCSTEEVGVVLRLRDQIPGMRRGEPGLAEQPHLVVQLVVPEHLRVEFLQRREQVRRLREALTVTVR